MNRCRGWSIGHWSHNGRSSPKVQDRAGQKPIEWRRLGNERGSNARSRERRRRRDGMTQPHLDQPPEDVREVDELKGGRRECAAPEANAIRADSIHPRLCRRDRTRQGPSSGVQCEINRWSVAETTGRWCTSTCDRHRIFDDREQLTRGSTLPIRFQFR